MIILKITSLSVCSLWVKDKTKYSQQPGKCYTLPSQVQAQLFSPALDKICITKFPAEQIDDLCNSGKKKSGRDMY